jgi:hypothetical protein
MKGSMTTLNIKALLMLWLLIPAALHLLGSSARGQGTITFDPYPPPLGSTFDYYEQAMWFLVAADPPHILYDPMVRMSSSYSPYYPYNGTRWMQFHTGSESNYVVFSLTNGNTFGLMSVDLADPLSFSATQQIIVSFSGVRADSSMVTASFLTPIGGTTNFTTFQFGADFASGLTSVKIPSRVWAMDNLVFGNVVPEPGSSALGLVGLMLFGVRAACLRWR